MTDIHLDTDEDHPRRLLAFPDGQLLAYGDECGTISRVDTKTGTARIVRQLDVGAIRALAYSSDGKRVAVGFDNGSTRIYEYDEYDCTCTGEEKEQHHPFIPAKSVSAEDDVDGFGGSAFMSQPDLEEEEEGNYWAGPPMEYPIRELAFLPQSHMLAISSEGGLCVVDVTSGDTMENRYLKAQADAELDGCGIRGVSISSDSNTILASLSMEGRLHVWKADGLENLASPLNKVPMFRDVSCCVPHRDVGEMNGSDALDRSCLPLFVKPNVIALPGKAHLQLRRVTLNGDKINVDEAKDSGSNADPCKGHLESIVALASVGECVVSSGRDGRVILWKLGEAQDGHPIAEFVQMLEEALESVPTSLYWKDSNNTLYMACADGKLRTVTVVLEKLQLKDTSVRFAKSNATADILSVLESATTSTKDAKIGNIRDLQATTSCKTKATKDIDALLDSDSDDVEDSNKENDLVSSPRKTKQPVSTQDDAILEDSDDDGPETQAPPQPYATTTTSDIDSDDDSFASDEKSPSKSKTNKDITVADQETAENDFNTTVESTSNSVASEDEAEFDIKGAPPAPSSEHLVKKDKTNEMDSDDEDTIFDDVKDFAKDSAAKKFSKTTFIDDEAEDTDEVHDDADKAIAEEPAEKVAADAGNTISNDAHVSTAEVTLTKIAVEAEGNDATTPTHSENPDDPDDSNSFVNYRDDESDGGNSMADDVAAFNKSYQGQASARSLPEPQAAFAPSSTPLDLDRRYLCWNHIGSVTLFQGGETGRRKVDINFTDSAFRRPIAFTDTLGFILGSMGDDGAMFATDLAEDDDLEDDDDVMEGLSLSAKTKAALKKSQKQRMRKNSGRRHTGSTIYFHRFETFGNIREKDWTLTLPDGERVLGCASGSGWAAAITSRKFFRLFSSGGNQGQIMWLPGAPVTIVGRNRFCAAFYHESMPLPDGTQRLGYMLYDAVANRIITKGNVSCISAGSSLSWAGFSNDCSLMAMDSDGMLSMLYATSMNGNAGDQDMPAPTSWEWAPLLDTIGLRKSTDDSFWPVTVYEGKLVCVPLKGGTQYPEAARRPVTSTIGLKMPLAKTTVLEEVSVRSNIALVQKKVNNDISMGDLMGPDFEEGDYHEMCIQVDKVSLKMFSRYVEAGKLERALDLVSRFQLEKSYDIAMQMGEQHHKLLDFIEAEKERRFGVVEADEESAGSADEDMSDEGGYSDHEDRLVHRASPTINCVPPTQKISPETGTKRSLDAPFGRNVRPKAVASK